MREGLGVRLRDEDAAALLELRAERGVVLDDAVVDEREAAAVGIEGLPNALVFSAGSDGTDGPTDAAGGVADGETVKMLRERGVDPLQSLDDNDAYHALAAVGGLIKTGATGTNVNDISILLLRAE